MRKLDLFLLLIISFLFLNDNVNCQNKTIIGFDFVNEFVHGELRPGIGINFESNFTNNSSIGVGLYYRTYIQTIYNVPIVNDIDIAERFLSIPVLYKYSSRIVNVSFGPSFEIFLDWKQKSSSSYHKVTSYNIDPDYSFGIMLKIGKAIDLADNFIFEPEIRFNPIFIIGRPYLGLGLNLKYGI
jgi:hypothetical protein